MSIKFPVLGGGYFGFGGGAPEGIRGFKKGLADRGGWRKEIHPIPWIQAFSLPHVPMPPYMSRRTQLWGTIFAVFWALLVHQPPPTNPFSKPLREVPISLLWAQGFF